MFRNYIKIAFRNLYRNKLHTTINIVGLGIAIACCIVGYVNYRFSRSFDKFHEYCDQLFAIHSNRIVDHNQQIWSEVPYPMISAIKGEIPGVRALSRLQDQWGIMQHNNSSFYEKFYFVDSDFFQMFSYKILDGKAGSWQDMNSIIISEEVARKYFGDENPVGKQLTTRFGDVAFDVTIQAVIENAPLNTTLQYSVLIPYSQLETIQSIELSDWRQRAGACVVQIAENSSISEIEQQLQTFINPTNQADPDHWQIKNYELVPFYKISDMERQILGKEPYSRGIHASLATVPGYIAFFVLLLACFNFMNLSISSSVRRLKEIGVRKTVGADRKQLILQFLGENIVLGILALLLGLALGEIMVPLFDRLWEELALTINYSKDYNFFAFLFFLMIFTAVVAGMYPAIYVSHFKVAEILRNRRKLSGNNLLIRILLAVQFSLAMINIILGNVFSKNSDYMRHVDLGYQSENVIRVDLTKSSQYSVFKNAIKNNEAVTHVAGTREVVGYAWYQLEAEVGERKVNCGLFQTGENYLEALDLNLLEGRPFNDRLPSEFDHSLIVNQKFCKDLGLTNPIGQYIDLIRNDQKKEYQIIGVVADFQSRDVDMKIEPTVLSLIEPEAYRSAIVRFDGVSESTMMAYLKKNWQQCFPDLPFDAVYTNQIRDGEIEVADAAKAMTHSVSVLALIIVAMGMFALIAQNIEKRTKEIAIRQILGASIINISRLLMKEFIPLFFIACVFASGVAYFLVPGLLKSVWQVYAGFGPLPVLYSFLAIIGIAMFTLSLLVNRITGTNPVESLRYE